LEWLLRYDKWVFRESFQETLEMIIFVGYSTMLLKREYCIVRKSGLLAGLLALSLATLFSSFWDFI